VAERLKELRRQIGITNVATLAKQCADVGAKHLTASVLMNIESGRRDKEGRRRRDVTVDELLELAQALGVSPLALLLPSANDEYRLTPERTTTAQAALEWLTGERMPPLPALGETDDWTEDDRIDSWREFQRLVDYAQQPSARSVVALETGAQIQAQQVALDILLSLVESKLDPEVLNKARGLRELISDLNSRLSQEPSNPQPRYPVPSHIPGVTAPMSGRSSAKPDQDTNGGSDGGTPDQAG
jgi:transcriptional regulator with XRE-family HTH domain